MLYVHSIKVCTHIYVLGFRSGPFCGPHILQKTEISSSETQGRLWVVVVVLMYGSLFLQVLQLYCEVFGEHVPLPSLLGSYFHISKDIVQVRLFIHLSC